MNKLQIISFMPQLVKYTACIAWQNGLWT